MILNSSIKKYLKEVQSSIFMFGFENEKPESDDIVQRSLLLTTDNKFIDKSLCFSIFENGLCGLNGEHSKLDGMPVATLCNFITS